MLACTPGSSAKSLSSILTHLIDIHREWRRRVPAEVGSSMSLADIAHLLTSSDHVHLFMQDLADMVGLSPVTFRRRFTGACGCSPSRYRQRHRLQCTAELLEQGLAVQEVAQRLGYSNPFGFSNQFHRHMRCRPRRD